jgi:diadenosine tetraphosphate (Ap4A) HIT family hydrolase
MLYSMMKTKDFLGREWEIDCMGCAISDQSMLVPGGFIQKAKYFCVHQDPLIPLPGFLVIASLRHIHSIADMQPVEYEEFSGLLRMTHHVIKQATEVEHLTIVQEENSIHFHLWFFPWTPQVVEKYGQPSLAKIREIMIDYRKQAVSDGQWKELEDSIVNIKHCFDM